jgi:uncharacterized protein CbrC (UPF0167 family)
MQFGVVRINWTSQCHDFAIFWGFAGTEDGAMDLDG